MPDSERRSYFRVDDEIGLTLTPLEGASYGDGALDDHRHVLQEQVHAGLEVQLRQALADVRTKHAEVAHVLDILNQKVNLIYNNEVADQFTPIVKPANLSACGIALPWPEPLKIGTQVQLHLFLLPMHQLVKTDAQVVAVDKNEHGDEMDPYVVRLDFVGISSMYQEMLIQHVVQRQSVHLRKRSGLDEGENEDADV